MDFDRFERAELIVAFPAIAAAKRSSVERVAISLVNRSNRGAVQTLKGKKEQREAPPVPPDYWTAVKRECYILFCTEQAKYKQLRSQISRYRGSSITVVVGIISAAISKIAGLAAGVVSPFIALVLYAVMSIGINSWCSKNAVLLE